MPDTAIPARWFYTGRLKRIRLIVVHCTVSPEMGTGAEDVARYFANLPATKKASAHKCVDNDSTVTCVNDEDTAFAAAGANSDGLHLELVGQPTQTREEWLDAFSTNELAIGQTVVDEWSAKYDIPLRWLTVAEVADGTTKGMCTHADVSAAFPAVSTGHWDPGPNFPKDIFPAHTPAPSPSTEDEIVKATYVIRDGHDQVCALLSSKELVPVANFADVEEVLHKTLGVEFVDYVAAKPITDGAGNTRNVWHLAGSAADSFGLPK